MLSSTSALRQAHSHCDIAPPARFWYNFRHVEDPLLEEIRSFRPVSTGVCPYCPKSDFLSVLAIEKTYDLKGVTGEAPAVFKHDGIYYFLTSHLTGWGPNPNKYAVAAAFLGPYETKGPFCAGPGADNSFGGQTTFVLPVAGKPGQFIWMADRVNAKSQTEIDDLRRATHIWLPIILDPAQKRLRVDWRDQWDLSVFDESSSTGGLK